MSGQFFGSFAFGAVDGAVRLGHADAVRLHLPLGLRRGVDRGAVLHQPLAQARARERRRAVPVHDADLGGALGYLVFGDVPDAPMLIGAAIIVASGLYIFWREQMAARETAFTPPPA